jgi:hypothetical protein
VVTSTRPGGRVAGGEEGVDLLLGEIGDEVALMTFGRDGQDALDGGGMFGMAEGGLSAGGRYLQ